MLIEVNEKEKQELITALKTVEKTKTIETVLKRLEKAHKIKPRSAKNKGLNYQKETAQKIADVIGIEYDQKNDDCLIHSRESGLNGVDIILRGEAAEKFPYSVECKNCNNISLAEWIDQAESNAKDNRPYILFVKSKRIKNDIVILETESFFTLFSQKIVKK